MPDQTSNDPSQPETTVVEEVYEAIVDPFANDGPTGATEEQVEVVEEAVEVDPATGTEVEEVVVETETVTTDPDSAAATAGIRRSHRDRSRLRRSGCRWRCRSRRSHGYGSDCRSGSNRHG